MDINALLHSLMPENTYAGLCSLLVFVCGLAALICTVLPAPSAASGVLYKVIYKILNILGANAGKAANADDAASRQDKQ